MKKNLYYAKVLARENGLKKFLFNFFLDVASSPRLFLEVFIRKDFGERYFSLFWVGGITVGLGLFPILWLKFKETVKLIFPAIGRTSDDPFPMHRFGTHQSVFSQLMPQYAGWYLFLAAFVGVGIYHHLRMKRSPSVFDFARYSLYNGTPHPLFKRLSDYGLKVNPRTIACYYEPAFFFIVGFIVSCFGQKLGGLLMLSAFFYAFGYMGAYWKGDNFVMDKIDEMLVNENLKKSFVGNAGKVDDKGFEFVGQAPESEDLRRRLLPRLLGEDGEAVEAE